jgi:hypothetical protein
MKAIASLVLLVGLVVLQSEASASPLLGKWTSTGVTVNGELKPMPAGMLVTMEFVKGGVFKVFMKMGEHEKAQTGTWSVAGKVLTATVDGKAEKMTFTVKGNLLDLIKIGKTEIMHLKR